MAACIHTKTEEGPSRHYCPRIIDLVQEEEAAAAEGEGEGGKKARSSASSVCRCVL